MDLAEATTQNLKHSQIRMNCSKHGEYASKHLSFNGRTIEMKCPVCIKEYNEKQKSITSAQLKKSLFSQCGIPEKFRNKGVASYHPTCEDAEKIHQRITNYISNFMMIKNKGVSLVFCGRSGTGKTQIGCSIVHDLILQEISAVYTSTKKLNEVSPNYRVGFEMSETAAIKFYVRPEFLVIDEIGYKNSNDFIRSLLYQIIDGRYERKRPTLLISNLNIVDLTSYVGERVMDRIFENHGALFQFTWDSYRQSISLKHSKQIEKDFIYEH